MSYVTGQVAATHLWKGLQMFKATIILVTIILSLGITPAEAADTIPAPPISAAVGNGDGFRS